MDKFPLTISLFPNVPPSVRFIPLEEDYDPPFPEVTYIVIQIIAKTLLLVLEQYQYIDIELYLVKYNSYCAQDTVDLAADC